MSKKHTKRFKEVYLLISRLEKHAKRVRNHATKIDLNRAIALLEHYKWHGDLKAVDKIVGGNKDVR